MPKAVTWTAVLLFNVAAFGISMAAHPVPGESELEYEGLSLAAAEHLALSLDPLLASAEALQQGLRARSTAAGTLPDPQIKLGVMNISAESFKLDQEPMTQTVLGVSQAFPPAGLRDAAAKRFSALADSQNAVAEDRRRTVRQKVRHAWLELFYQRQAKVLVMQSENVFTQLAKITQYQYRAGRGNQQHVVRAQLEQSLLKDRETEIEIKREQAKVALEKWIGSGAGIPDMTFPKMPTIIMPKVEDQALSMHPGMQVLMAQMDAARQGVSMEKSRKNPGWMLDVSYGRREADRDDLFTAMIKLDVPLFTGSRQDQLVMAGRAQLTVAEQRVEEKRRSLREMLAQSVATYRRTSQRMDYFTNTLLPQASQNTEAALNAYQSGVSDFGIVVRARLTELNSRLKYLRLKVDRAKASADIAYLVGEPSA